MLDVKGVKGYASFADVWAGAATFIPQYFPRLVAINTQNAEMTSLKMLGDGKYFLKQRFTGLYNKQKHTLTYIGRDLKYKNLWMGQGQL